MPKVVPGYKEEAKTKIIHAARTIFAKKGYHATTMDDIAEEIGVSKGALYSYFASKEELLKEIYLQSHQDLRSAIKAACQRCSLSETLEEVYKMITERYKGNLHTHFEEIALASHDKKIRNVVMENYRRDIETVASFLDEKVAQGLLRTDIDIATLAELFTALYLGTMEKLVMGFPEEEVHDQWIKSMTLILGTTKQSI